MRPRARRATLLVAVGLFAAACQQVVPAPAPPATDDASAAGTAAACSSADPQAATPTPSAPIEYVAAVDASGPGAPGVATFRASTVDQKNDQIGDLQGSGAVLSVEPNCSLSAIAVDPSDDPLYCQQWALDDEGNGSFQLGCGPRRSVEAVPPVADFPRAWGAGFDGQGITIAVLDSGAQATHEDLAGQVLQGADFLNDDGPDGAPLPEMGDSDWGRIDHNGHGTHVAGIAAALDNTLGGLGGAPAAKILPGRVLDAQGQGFYSTIEAGIYWAIDQQGAQIISMSLGGVPFSATLATAVDYARDQGVVVVAAAGNNNSATPVYPAGYGAAGGVIAAAATDSAGRKSSFSNFGPYVGIAAPGSDILSTYIPGPSTYKYLSGTSMAAPFVAAAAALLLQHCPGLDPATVLQILQDTGAPVLDYTFKRMQVGAAVGGTCPP